MVYKQVTFFVHAVLDFSDRPKPLVSNLDRSPLKGNNKIENEKPTKITMAVFAPETERAILILGAIGAIGSFLAAIGTYGQWLYTRYSRRRQLANIIDLESGMAELVALTAACAAVTELTKKLAEDPTTPLQGILISQAAEDAGSAAGKSKATSYRAGPNLRQRIPSRNIEEPPEVPQGSGAL
ncbi:hypothetical protein F5Y06DRAFT_295698 [Hypoxylon sp. FL0890]|nr:hypothetical protein F5Y06DRAFT_295698 [Hypoxylon sp. FL0890]